MQIVISALLYRYLKIFLAPSRLSVELLTEAYRLKLRSREMSVVGTRLTNGCRIEQPRAK
jgi:hypothetical protein